jgi:tape measure domain-containing protein
MANGYTYEIKLRDLMTAQLNRAKNAASAVGNKMTELAQKISKSMGQNSTSINQLTQKLVALQQKRDSAFSTREIGNYNRAIKQTEKQLQRLQNLPSPGILGRFRNMASQIGSIIGLTGGLGIVLAGLGAGAGVIKLGSDLEQTRISFQTMMGSAEKGNNMLKDINALGASTPFANKDLQQNAKLLLNFGVAGQKVIPTLKTLGDVSGGNSERLNQLTLAYSQVASAGKLQGQDLMQMVNAGFNPLNEISRITGESLGDLRKKMEDGGISAKMVELALKSATSEGGMFHNMMEKQSKTLGGKWSTFLDTVTDKMAVLGESMTPYLSKIIDVAQVALGSLMKLPDWIDKNQTTLLILGGVAGTVALAIGAVNTVLYIAALRSAWLNKETKLQIFWGRIVTAWEWSKQAALWAVAGATSFVALVTNKAAMAAKLQAFWSGIVTGATKVWTTIQWGLNAAMAANPIGAIIAGIVALITLIAAAVYKYEEWGAAVLLLLGPLGLLINVIMAVKRNWGSVKEAFTTGGIIGGLKRIGIVLLDALLYPVQQLLKLLSKIPGLGKLAGGGAEWIENTRKKLNLIEDAPAKKKQKTDKKITKTTSFLDEFKGRPEIKKYLKLLKTGKPKDKTAEEIAAEMNGELNGTGSGGSGGKNGKGAKDKANEIITGGKKSTVFNINIENVVKDIVQNISTGKETADDLVDEILDQLTRRLHGTFRSAAE